MFMDFNRLGVQVCQKFHFISEKSPIVRVRGGDNPSVKIEPLEAEKITKMKWLALGCIEAFFFCNTFESSSAGGPCGFLYECTIWQSDAPKTSRDSARCLAQLRGREVKPCGVAVIQVSVQPETSTSSATARL